MGRVKLDEKFKKYTGMLPPNGHRFYLTNRYGETIISHCPLHRDPGTVTENQLESCDVHTKATKIADNELKDPIKKDEWRKKWIEAITVGGQNYKTLRGFTIAQVRKTLSN